MNRSILTILLFLNFSFASGQNHFAKGVEFWLGFQENIFTPDLSVAISSGRNTSGVISIPLAGWSQNFSITADSVTQISIPLNLGMAISSDTAESRAIHIISSDTISVVALNTYIHSADATTILPVQLTGNSYFIFSYQGINGAKVSEFLIVPLDTNTTVTIIPTDTTDGGKFPNTAFNVTLQQGEVYQLKSTLGDLTGSYVTSSKPLAVFGGHQCAIIPSGAWCNHLYEQMHPVSAWGQQFITMPLKTRLNGDTYIIMASQDSTFFTINNSTSFYLNTGETYKILLSNPSRINANKPIAVAHYSNSQTYDNVLDSDPFMIMLSPLQNVAYKSLFTTYTLNFVNAYYLNILTTTNNIALLKLDGAFINPQLFQAIPSSIYSYAQLTITSGIHKIESDSGYIAYSYGYGNADGYGFAVGDITLSNITGIENPSQYKNNLIDIIPNPFSDKTLIRIKESGSENLTILLKNTEGKILLNENMSEEHEYILERRNLPAGLYFIQVYSDKEIMITSKLIIE